MVLTVSIFIISHRVIQVIVVRSRSQCAPPEIGTESPEKSSQKCRERQQSRAHGDAKTGVYTGVHEDYSPLRGQLAVIQNGSRPSCAELPRHAPYCKRGDSLNTAFQNTASWHHWIDCTLSEPSRRICFAPGSCEEKAPNVPSCGNVGGSLSSPEQMKRMGDPKALSATGERASSCRDMFLASKACNSAQPL